MEILTNLKFLKYFLECSVTKKEKVIADKFILPLNWCFFYFSLEKFL